MRSDYALYAVAIIFFIITGVVSAYPPDHPELWVVATAVLGFLFVGIGYTQRPKPTALAIEAPSPTTAPLTVTEVKKEEKAETIPETVPSITSLTEVKGIGEKRADQLKALGISSVEELAKASAKELATKLKISPKITERWIENARKLVEKS